VAGPGRAGHGEETKLISTPKSGLAIRGYDTVAYFTDGRRQGMWLTKAWIDSPLVADTESVSPVIYRCAMPVFIMAFPIATT